jgi:hypothetical protein
VKRGCGLVTAGAAAGHLKISMVVLEKEENPDEQTSAPR